MKRFFCLVFCLLFCSISSCSRYNSGNDGYFDKTEYNEIIDSGKYYCIYDGDAAQCYVIYDKNGEIVLSEETDRPLSINMLNSDIVDIKVGMGSGLTIHKYYNGVNNVFSEEFTYVLTASDELVAYIDIPKENSMENRKVVVQNIFDKNLFYKDFQIDFSYIDTPVIEAEFSSDGTSLQLTYLSGEEQTQITKTLEF